jgi:transporter family protein
MGVPGNRDQPGKEPKMSRGLEMIALSLIAILGWGLYGIFARLGTARIGMQAVFWTQLAMLVGAIIYLSFLRNMVPLASDGRGILLGVATGLSSIVAVVALFTLLHRGFPVSIVYPLTALYPLVTVILGVIFLGESLTFAKGIGVILAVVAIVILSS